MITFHKGKEVNIKGRRWRQNFHFGYQLMVISKSLARVIKKQDYFCDSMCLSCAHVWAQLFPNLDTFVSHFFSHTFCDKWRIWAESHQKSDILQPVILAIQICWSFCFSLLSLSTALPSVRFLCHYHCFNHIKHIQKKTIIHK